MIFVNGKILILIITAHCIGLIFTTSVGCRDENNDIVDWFYIYKLPKYYSNESESNGLRYIFLTSKTFAVDGWQLSTHLINETGSIPGRTIQELPARNDSVLLLAYNDENPNGTTDFYGGHTKGVLAASNTTGFWLIHSVPKYPLLPDYDYPKTGEHYGQSFLCISLDASQMDIVGEQLLYNEPKFYYNQIPESLKGKFEKIEKAIDGEWVGQKPFYNLKNLTSVGGTVFKSFAKGKHFNQDIYEDLVASTIKSNLYVETWRNGPGNLKSNCSKSDKVFNIAKLEIPSINISFKTTSDHSKWAVSSNDTTNWICVGDINRQQSQFHRGGGIVCQENAKVANSYREMVTKFDPCERSNSLKSFMRKILKVFKSKLNEIYN